MHPPCETNLREAIAAWTKLLGCLYVQSDQQSWQAASMKTFATTQKVSAIIQPADRLQVQECLRIANRFQTQIYPISCGKNWGYGSRVPVKDGSVILDLGRLNRVLDFDEKRGCVTVEPGVTVAQLYKYLRDIKPNLMMSVIGSWFG